MKAITAMAAVGLMASAAWASNINISVQQTNGTNSITVPPGASVDYQIIGELTDSLNDGLALIGLSLNFTGGDLTAQADEPTSAPMTNFDIPDGITNPAGFGGTLIAGDLVQIGGAQNTIKNTIDNAAFPIGTVIANLAQPGAPLVMVTGTLTAPMAAGVYDLIAFDVFANVIKDGETGEVFFATEAAGVGTVTNLQITVDVCPGAAVASSIPPFTAVGSTSIPTNGTLWRTLRHVMRVDFSEPAGCPALVAPTAGQIRIRELLPSGAFGSDLSASFTYTIEAGNVLRIREPSATATVLSDNKWYAISNNGWPNVAPFEIHFPVNVGDFDGNRFTTATDVSGVNSAPGGAQADQSRADINGDGFKTATDVSLTNSNQGPPPVKPSGH